MASVDDKTLYSIFSNLEVLIHCNKEMLAQLEKVMENTPPGEDQVIGFVFTQLVGSPSLSLCLDRRRVCVQIVSLLDGG